jgi:hypothetical protein
MENKTSEEIREIQKKLREVKEEIRRIHPAMDARKLDWIAKRSLCLIN